MRRYYKHRIKKIVSVQNLVSIEFLNLKSGFFYPEEMHDFCELFYVYNGKVTSYQDKEPIKVKENSLVLIPPNMPHSMKMENSGDATVLFICFYCKSDLIDILQERIVPDKDIRALIDSILAEARLAFKFPFMKKLIPLENSLPGAQQLIENRIEEILIRMARTRINSQENIRFFDNDIVLENTLVRDITAILKSNIEGKITLSDISEQTYYSKTFIEAVFKKHKNTTIMQYNTILKIEKAKELLREEKLSVGEVAERLGYENANYFIKVFKSQVGITPLKYKNMKEKGA